VSKNKWSRIIPINELVEETLRKHPKQIANSPEGPRPCPFVLAGPDGKLHQNLNNRLSLLLNKAELPRVRIHDLRHSFASNLVIEGVPLNVVQELLGHRNIQMTMIYAHLAPNAKQAAVASLLRRTSQDEDVNSREANVRF